MKPHFLEALVKSGEYEDDNGDFHAGKEEWVTLCKCDCIPAGKANEITTPDGVVLKYAYEICLPKGVRELRTGETIRISFNGNGQLVDKKEFVVKGFHSYQCQCKVWV